VSLHHNVTTEIGAQQFSLFTVGPIDMLAVIFYMLLMIVLHAFVQEFILDKLSRKVRLSKVKHSKFNESGQLLVFYLVSAVWAGTIVYEDDYFSNFNKMWTAYPHALIGWRLKMFMVVQMSYWLHWFPELYLQRIRKEEIAERISYISLYLIAVAGAYMLSLCPVLVLFLFVHYISESLFHAARLCYFAERSHVARYAFVLWDVIFPVVRLITAVVAVYIFWHGLGQASVDVIDLGKRNFNTIAFRISTLAFVVLIQCWLLYRFLTFMLRHRRERALSKKNAAKPNKHHTNGKAVTADKDISGGESSAEQSATAVGGESNDNESRRRK